MSALRKPNPEAFVHQPGDSQPDPSPTSGPTSFDPYADPAEFWADQGKGMLAPWDPVKDATQPQREAEQALWNILRNLEYRRSRPITDIFEAGCGRGRLAHFFKRNWPTANYSAIDVGPLQLAEAKRLVPSGHFTEADLLSYTEPRYDAGPTPEPEFFGYDLVVASEVLMHVRPHELKKALQSLLALVDLGSPGKPPANRPAGRHEGRRSSGHLVLIEWTPLKGELEATSTAYWNFPHDYLRAIRDLGAKVTTKERTGRQTIFVVKP